MNLEFAELRQKCEMDDTSDVSIPAWKHSTGYYSATPGRPFSAFKRKTLDESNASNETFVVKRARLDDEVADDSEFVNETVVNNALDDGESLHFFHPEDTIKNEDDDRSGIIQLYS